MASSGSALDPSDVKVGGLAPTHVAGQGDSLMDESKYKILGNKLDELLLNNKGGVDVVPHIQAGLGNVVCKIQPVESHPIHYLDQNSYRGHYSEWLDWLGRLEDLLKHGKEMVAMLYTFRSVSKAIPMTSDAAASGGESTSALYRETFAILHPEVLKLRDLMAFCNSINDAFTDCVKVLEKRDWRALPVPDALFLALVRVIDLLQRLDSLKDSKASLNNDFARYKRAWSAIKASMSDSEEVAEMVHKLSLFLASPLHAKHLIFHAFKDQANREPSTQPIALHMLQVAQEYVLKEQYVMGEEKWQLMRAIPHLLWLIDVGDNQVKKMGETSNGAKSAEPLNVFKNKTIRLAPLQDLFKRYPVVPEFLDMTCSLTHALKEAPHYDPETMDRLWGRGEDGDAKVAKAYDLRDEYKTIKTQYDAFLSKFTLLAQSVKARATKGKENEGAQDKAEMLVGAKVVADTVLEGMRCLHRWSCCFLEFLAYKATHPCPIDVAERLGGRKTTPGFEYQCVGRYNYNKAELTVMVEVLSMCKTLGDVMAREEHALAPSIRLYMHDRVQSVVQGDLVPVLHRVFKWKRPLLEPLLELRRFCADWKDGAEPTDDYKRYRRAHGPVKPEMPQRVVNNSMTQLQLLRCTLQTVLSTGRVKGGTGSCFQSNVRDLTPEEAVVLQGLWDDSLYFPYLLDYSATLQHATDFSPLWFRERYLELTRQIQFPIDMSLPWILAEHVLQHQSVEVPLVERGLLVLDVYNDAAQCALYVLGKQYLYDELEAEVNLGFDQWAYLMAEDVYSYFKDKAASQVLDKVYKKRLDNTRGGSWLQQPVRRFHVALAQRHVRLLGRVIDVNDMLTQSLHLRLAGDVDLAIKRFESSDPCGVLDLELCLNVLRTTHRLLAKHAPSLPPFPHILHDVNDGGGLGGQAGPKSRIALHVQEILLSELLPNFSYNMYTQRFVRSPVPGRKTSFNPTPKGNVASQLLGELCYKAFEHQAKLWRHYFGREHLVALQRLLGPAFGQALKEVLLFLEERLFFLKVYQSALLPGIPPIKLPKFIFKTGGVYGALETQLAPLLEYEDLKPEVFQTFRELGNGLALFREASDVLDVASVFDTIQTAPLLGSRYTSEGFIQQSVADAPLLRQAGTLAEALRREGGGSSRIKASEPVVTFAGDMERWALCNGVTNGNKPSLFQAVLRRCDAFLTAQGIKGEWQGGEPENGVLEVEGSREFYRFYSAMAFLFSVNKPTATQTQRGELPPDDERFGHGFTLAGTAIVHLLGQKDRFQLLDFSQHVLNVQEYEQQCTAPGGDGKVGTVELSLQQSSKTFLARASKQRLLTTQLWSMLERAYPIPPPSELLIFHPPKTL